MTESMICYFGFGSLVNAKTRPHHPDAIPVRLNGWRRCWSHRAVSREHTRRQSAENKASQAAGWTVLSVEPSSGSAIEGMLVTIDKDELPALDERESGYDRLSLPIDLFAAVTKPSHNPPDESTPHKLADLLKPGLDKIYMYASANQQAFDATAEFPLLQSYVDCVMAGYETEFGIDGIHRFMQTTRGWHAPMIKDRAQPRYLRSVSLSVEQAARYDQMIKDYG